MNTFKEEQDSAQPAEPDGNSNPQTDSEGAETPSVPARSWKVFVVVALALLIIVTIVAKNRSPRSEEVTQAGVSSDEASPAVSEEGFRPETVLATVNSNTITLAQLNEAMQALHPERRKMFAAEKDRLLDEMVAREVLIQEATALAIMETEAYAEAAASHAPHPGHEDEMLIKVLLDEEIFASVEISEKELRDFYDRNKAQMPKGEGFDSLKDAIREHIRLTKGMTALQDYISDLKARAEITFNSEWIEAQRQVAADNPLDRVLGKGKPVLADFGRDTCTPCTMMKPILEKLAEDLKDNVHVLVLNLDEYEQFVNRFEIRLIPLQLFFDENGKLLYRNESFMPRQDLLSKMKELGMLPE